MEILHIPAKSKLKVKLKKSQIALLPKKLAVVSAIQFLDQLEQLASELKALNAGQVLGCNVAGAEKVMDRIDAFLFIGSGEFHPIALAVKTKKPVYCFSPKTGQLSKLNRHLVERFQQRKKAALVKFLSSKKIGILVSVKPGQNRLDDALALKAKLKDKELFIFIFDTLDITELENFPFVECWVNTACPRLAEEKGFIINIDDLPDKHHL